MRAAAADEPLASASVPDPCPTGVCGSDVPPLIGSLLTGTGLTLAQAAAALERGEEPSLTPVQRRLVEEFTTGGRAAR